MELSVNYKRERCVIISNGKFSMCEIYYSTRDKKYTRKLEKSFGWSREIPFTYRI